MDTKNDNYCRGTSTRTETHKRTHARTHTHTHTHTYTPVTVFTSALEEATMERPGSMTRVRPKSFTYGRTVSIRSVGEGILFSGLHVWCVCVCM